MATKKATATKRKLADARKIERVLTDQARRPRHAGARECRDAKISFFGARLGPGQRRFAVFMCTQCGRRWGFPIRKFKRIPDRSPTASVPLTNVLGRGVKWWLCPKGCNSEAA
jgi:hypothetical protein